MPILSVPINLVLTSLDTLTIFSKFEKTREFHNALNQDLNLKNSEDYLRKLKEVIQWYMVSDEVKSANADNPVLTDLLERKTLKFSRYVSKKTLPEIKLLLDFINQCIQKMSQSDSYFEKIKLQLKKVLGLLEKRMEVEAISLLAHLLIIAAFTLFLGGYTAALPFVLMSSGLALLLLHDFKE